MAGGQFPDLPQVTLFEQAAERQRFGQERVAVQVAVGQFLADLDERQRVAARLRDDPVRDRGPQPRPGRRREHGAGVVGGQPGQAEFGQAAQAARGPRGLADGEDDGDGVGVQPPGHERERVSGFLIQAVRVVDQAQQRLAGGLPGEQPQRGQPDEEAVRWAAFRHAERHPQRGALGRGQQVEGGQQGAEQLVHGGEAELHLALDAVDPDDLHGGPGHRLGVIQQGRLAHARLAPEHQNAAHLLAGSRHDLIELPLLCVPPEQPLHGANLLPAALPGAALSRGRPRCGPRAARDAGRLPMAEHGTS